MKGDSLYQSAEVMGNSEEIRRRHCTALATESPIDIIELPVEPRRSS